jgi:hypothetical protein
MNSDGVENYSGHPSGRTIHTSKKIGVPNFEIAQRQGFVLFDEENK